MKKKRILSGFLILSIAFCNVCLPNQSQVNAAYYDDDKNNIVNNSNNPPDTGIIDDPGVSKVKIGEITDSNGIEYSLYSDKTARVVDFTGEKIEITIPSNVSDENGASYEVNEIGQAFDGKSIKTVQLPNSIQIIDYNAFYNCTQLERINFPLNLKSIGSNAFCNCISLTSVDLSSNVESISYGVFQKCESLKIFSIPSGVKSIGDYVFSGCTHLEKILVDSNNEIFYDDNGVLYGYKDLICYPEGKKDESYTVLDNTRKIDSALYNNLYISSIIIPNTVSSISCSFNGCDNLDTITVLAGNNNYKSDGGVLYSKDGTELLRYPSAKLGKTFNIPDSVVKVDSDAFNGCKNLEGIFFNENVETIYGRSFIGCTKLKNISYLTDCESECNISNWDNMYDSMSPYDGFLNCSSLESISIPNGVTTILYNQFTNCSSLKNVTIPESVISIDNGQRYPYKKTFEDCNIKKTIHGFDGSYAQYYAGIKGFDWHSHGQATYIPNLEGIYFNYTEKGVSLSWNGVFVNTDFAKQFKVYRSETPTGIPVFIGMAVPQTSYDGFNHCNYCDKGIEFGKNYYYYVTTVIDETHESDFSNALSIETPQGVNSPQIKSISLSSDKKRILISWDWINGINKYNIYRSLSENCTDPKIEEVNSAGYSDTSWEPNTTYYYFVSSVMADRTESALSKPFSFTTPSASPTPQPSAPEILSATYNNGTAFIIWNKNVTNAKGSNVYRSEVLGATPTLISESCQYSTYADNTVVAGKTYYYYVKVIKEDGTLTDFSNYKSVTIPSAPTPTTNSISGTIPNFSTLNGTATIKLINSKGVEVGSVKSTDGSYSFNSNIVVGEKYKLRVTMPRCAPREYDITGKNIPVTQDALILQYGDPDGNGVIEAKDATQILLYEVGKTCCIKDENGIVNEYLVSVAHVLPTGELSAKDATQILRYDVGLHPNIFDTLS